MHRNQPSILHALPSLARWAHSTQQALESVLLQQSSSSLMTGNDGTGKDRTGHEQAADATCQRRL